MMEVLHNMMNNMMNTYDGVNVDCAGGCAKYERSDCELRYAINIIERNQAETSNMIQNCKFPV